MIRTPGGLWFHFQNPISAYLKRKSVHDWSHHILYIDSGFTIYIRGITQSIKCVRWWSPTFGFNPGSSHLVNLHGIFNQLWSIGKELETYQITIVEYTSMPPSSHVHISQAQIRHSLWSMVIDPWSLAERGSETSFHGSLRQLEDTAAMSQLGDS